MFFFFYHSSIDQFWSQQRQKTAPAPWGVGCGHGPLGDLFLGLVLAGPECRGVVLSGRSPKVRSSPSSGRNHVLGSGMYVYVTYNMYRTLHDRCNFIYLQSWNGVWGEWGMGLVSRCWYYLVLSMLFFSLQLTLSHLKGGKHVKLSILPSQWHSESKEI